MNALVMEIRASGLVGSNGNGGVGVSLLVPPTVAVVPGGDSSGGLGMLAMVSLMLSGRLISIPDKLLGRLSKYREVVVVGTAVVTILGPAALLLLGGRKAA